MSLEERLDVLRRDQTHIVTERRQLSCDKMRAGTCFHPDQAARDIAEPASKLMPGDLLLQNNRTARVEPDQMERVLAAVDPTRADWIQCVLRCAHRVHPELCVTPPLPPSSRVGAGRGRAIPLPDSCTAAQIALFVHLGLR